MVTVVPCLGCVLGNSFFVCFLRRFRKSVRILKLKVPLFCGSDGISWKGHVTVAPSPKLRKGKKKKKKKKVPLSVSQSERAKLVVVRDRAVMCRVQNLILSREVLVHGRRTS